MQFETKLIKSIHAQELWGRNFGDVVTYYAKLLTGKKTKLIKLYDYSILQQPRLNIPGVLHTANCAKGGTYLRYAGY